MINRPMLQMMSVHDIYTEKGCFSRRLVSFDIYSIDPNGEPGEKIGMVEIDDNRNVNLDEIEMISLCDLIELVQQLIKRADKIQKSVVGNIEIQDAAVKSEG